MRFLLVLVLLLAPLAAADDANGDGRVDLQDLLLVAQHYGRTAGFDARADRNGDGRVDVFDLVRAARQFGTASAGPLHTDSFETYPVNGTWSGGANGFSWGGFPETGEEWEVISSDYAYTGSQSLRFHFAGNPDLNDDAWAEQRFTIAPDAATAPSEVWIEFMLRVPDNFVHRDVTASGEWNNNKLLVVWAEDYDWSTSSSFVGYEYIRENATSSYLRVASAMADGYETRLPDAVQTIAGTLFDDSMLGQWIRVRTHIKAEPNASIVDVWRDDTKIAGLPSDYSIANPAWSMNYFRYGYLLGWANSGFDEDTDFYVDDFTIWTSDPGWWESTPPVRSGGAPSGTLSAGTTNATISLTTDEEATCGYSPTVGTAYQDLTEMSVTGATSHSTLVTDLSDGQTYEYAIRCQDSWGNANMDDYLITFSVDAAATPGGFFADDFEGYATGNTLNGAGANGFRWLGSEEVTGELSRSGSQSLKFKFGPTEPDGSTHWWTEQNFDLGAVYEELWMEMYIYFPDGTEGLGSAAYDATGYGAGSSNNKLVSIWPASISNPTAARAGYNDGFWLYQTWELNGGPDASVDVNVDDSYPGSNHPIVTDGVRGRWVQWRQHARMSSARGVADGMTEFWIDGVLQERLENIVFDPETADLSLGWRYGYLLGYDNSRFPQNTWIYVDDVSFHAADPGW